MIEVKMNDPAGVILTTAGQKCNQNIKVVPGFDIPEEYDGAYELLVPTVSGVWVFNEVLPEEEEWISQNVTFISAGKEYEGINKTYSSKNGLDMEYIKYDDGGYAYNHGGFTKEEYRTIDFGTTAQEVSEEFLAWLTANAVKQ